MPARNLISERNYQNIGGANTTSSILNLQPFECADINNGDLTTKGSVEKRGGYRPFNGQPWNENKIRLIKEFILDGGVKQIVVFGTNGTVTSGGFAVLSGTPFATGSHFDEILTTAYLARPSMVQFEKQLFLFNGQTDRVWNGTDVARVGIEAPETAATGTADAGGVLNTGTYIFTYSYRNSQTFAESNLAPLTEVNITSGQKIVVTDIEAGDPTKANKIRFYRTVVNGSQLFFEKEIAITETTVDLGDAAQYEDGVIVVNPLAEFDNDLPPNSSVAHKIGNRIFMRDEENKNNVYFSKVSPQYGAMPESYPVEQYIECDPDDGDHVVGINDANGIPLIYKQRSFGAAHQTLQNVYIYRKIADIECLGHHTLINKEQSVMWMTNSNVYMTDGVSVARVGDTIEKSIKDLNFVSGSNYSGVLVGDKQQIRFAVCGDNAGVDGEIDTIFVGDYKQGLEHLSWSFYRPVGDDHPAIQAGSLGTRIGNDNKVEYLFGNSKGNGYLYQMDYGYSDVEDDETVRAIYFEYITRWLDFGIDADKLFKYLNLKARTMTGATAYLFVGANYNLLESVSLIKNIPLRLADEPVWADGSVELAKWGDNLWSGGGGDYIDENCHFHKKAKQAQFVFRNSDIGTAIELIGWGAYAGVGKMI